MQTHVAVLFKCVLMWLFVLLTNFWLSSSRVAFSSRSVSISKRKNRRRNNGGGAKKTVRLGPGRVEEGSPTQTSYNYPTRPDPDLSCLLHPSVSIALCFTNSTPGTANFTGSLVPRLFTAKLSHFSYSHTVGFGYEITSRVIVGSLNAYVITDQIITRQNP